MKNPKTTIAGYLTIVIAVLTVAQHWLATGSFALTDIQTVIGAVSGVLGVGLVAAADGGH